MNLIFFFFVVWAQCRWILASDQLLLRVAVALVRFDHVMWCFLGLTMLIETCFWWEAQHWNVCPSLTQWTNGMKPVLTLEPGIPALLPHRPQNPPHSPSHTNKPSGWELSRTHQIRLFCSEPSSKLQDTNGAGCVAVLLTCLSCFCHSSGRVSHDYSYHLLIVNFPLKPLVTVSQPRPG